MSSPRLWRRLACVALVLFVLFGDYSVLARRHQTTRNRHKKHIVHHKATAAAAAVPPVPPLQMLPGMPPLPGMGMPLPPMMDPAAAAAAAAAGVPTPDLMRFAEAGANAGLGVDMGMGMGLGNMAAGGVATSAGGDGSADSHFENALYNLLSKKRDEAVERANRIKEKQKQNEKTARDLSSEINSLKNRQLQLARLEACLDQLNGNASFTQPAAPRTGVAQETSGNATAWAAQLKTREEALKQREEAVLRREREMTAQQDKLKQALIMFQQQQQQWEAKINQDALARSQELNRLASLNSSVAQAPPKEIVKVRYVKVPEPVYRTAVSGCEALTECGSCTAAAGCGWCDTTRVCLPTTNGTSAECDAASWNYNFCKAEKCQQHSSCRSCMADPRCGMCGDTGACMAGELTGPVGATCSKWNYATDFRFLSYNIYGRDLRNCTGRAWWLFKMIKQADADFVMLQEVEDWFLEALAQEQWALNYHLSDFGSGHAPGGLLVMSKYPLESVSYYEKTDPGQVEVDQRARMMVVKPKLGSRNLALVSTDLDWRSASSRVEALDFITSVLNATSDVVLGGDFNFDANSEPETSHISARFSDVWSRVHPDQHGFTWDPTQNSYAKESDPTSSPSRIDRIFVKSDFWAASKIDKIGCPEASPHYGLLSEMSLFGSYC